MTMFRRIAALFMLGAAFAGAWGCHRNEVRLQIAPGSNEYVWREPVDVEKYEEDLDEVQMPIDLPTGYAEAREHPPDEFVMSSHVDWNSLVRQLGTELRNLIELHNQGAISLQEYQKRLQDMEGALSSLREMRESIMDRLKEYRGLRDEWHTLRWRTTEEAGDRRESVQARITSLRSSVQEALREARRMIEKIQGTQPAPDIWVHR